MPRAAASASVSVTRPGGDGRCVGDDRAEERIEIRVSSTACARSVERDVRSGAHGSVVPVARMKIDEEGGIL